MFKEIGKRIIIAIIIILLLIITFNSLLYFKLYFERIFENSHRNLPSNANEIFPITNDIVDNINDCLGKQSGEKINQFIKSETAYYMLYHNYFGYYHGFKINYNNNLCFKDDYEKSAKENYNEFKTIVERIINENNDYYITFKCESLETENLEYHLFNSGYKNIEYPALITEINIQDYVKNKEYEEPVKLLPAYEIVKEKPSDVAYAAIPILIDIILLTIVLLYCLKKNQQNELETSTYLSLIFFVINLVLFCISLFITLISTENKSYTLKYFLERYYYTEVLITIAIFSFIIIKKYFFSEKNMEIVKPVMTSVLLQSCFFLMFANSVTDREHEQYKNIYYFFVFTPILLIDLLIKYIVLYKRLSKDTNKSSSLLCFNIIGFISGLQVHIASLDLFDLPIVLKLRKKEYNSSGNGNYYVIILLEVLVFITFIAIAFKKYIAKEKSIKNFIIVLFQQIIQLLLFI